MAERDYRAIANRVVEAWNRHDARAVAQLYTEDATLWDPTLPQPLRGRKALEEFTQTMMRAFPDLRGESANVFGSGDHIAIEFVMRGTHEGPLAGPQGEIPPTGRRVEMRACQISRLTADGLFQDDRTYYDTAGMMQQLGLMPGP